MGCECAICKNKKPFEMPDEIVSSVINGDMVLFCGAGISTEGRDVLPFSFYESIQQEMGLDDNNVSFSELMEEYCKRPNGRKKLLKKIRERIQYIRSFPELERRAVAFHNELAEIHSIHKIITTNWDTFFEDCCGAIPITIPEDVVFIDENVRHVIKVHGSINNLSTIIATSSDYKKCYKSLQNGAIGAVLKTALSTKTVVFVGFSFGDEDLLQIIDYLRKEMKDVYPHIYLVTLDEGLKDKLKYDNTTAIITSGTYFLHSLKQILIEQGFIVNTFAKQIIPVVLDLLRDLHDKVVKVDLKEYPSAAFTLSYQDGVIHCFERFVQNEMTGEYNRPGYIGAIAQQYELLTKEKRSMGNYWDEAYYEGYTNGLILIEACGDDFEVANEFPYLYLPNAKEPLTDFRTYMRELKRVSNNSSKFHRYAKRITEESANAELTIHHPPY